jgi:hypothetical protein
MSEWGSVVAVFWALYLADGVSGGRRERLFLSSWRPACAWRLPRWRRAEEADGKKPKPKPKTKAKGASPTKIKTKTKPELESKVKLEPESEPTAARRVQPGRTATLSQAGWHFAPPLPWAWTLALVDLPASFAPEGLTNWPSASTARPPDPPEQAGAARWENLEKPGAAGGWLTLGGRRFAPMTAALDALEWRRLAEDLRGLPAAERAARLAAWQGRRFSVLRARRRLAAGLARTRGLAWLNTLQFAGWLVVSAGLLAGWFDPSLPFGEAGSWRWLAPVQLRWWCVCGWLLATHLLAVGMAWDVHRKLHPTMKEERGNLIFSALMLPSQALRLRAALLRPLARGLAPLAAVLAAGTPTTARAAATATLRDVHFPVRPPDLPLVVRELADAAASLVRPAVERALADATAGGLAGVRSEDLLAPPGKLEHGVCAYCPRCGDGFLREDGVCPQGVKLRVLSRPPR